MSAPGGGGAYSFSLTTFSPSGKLVQIEHALAAVAGGTTSLGIKVLILCPVSRRVSYPYPPPALTNEPTTNISATNGVVLATEKKSPSLLLDTSVLEKVAPICPNIGFVYSGMGPDFRVLVAKARKIAQAYWKVYGEYPPTKVLVQEVANVMQKATQSGGVRPYGVSLLIAGWDSHRGQSLYQVDPSGSYWAWKASAIGKNMVNGKTFLEKRPERPSHSKLPPFSTSRPVQIQEPIRSHSLGHPLRPTTRYNDDLSLEDAIHTALLTLKEGFEGQMTEHTIEIGVVTVPTPEQMQEKPGERLPPTFRKLTEQEAVSFSPSGRAESRSEMMARAATMHPVGALMAPEGGALTMCRVVSGRVLGVLCSSPVGQSSAGDGGVAASDEAQSQAQVRSTAQRFNSLSLPLITRTSH
ncbi:Proteasome subunit alpha type-2 [Saitozyma podzolica]|uniref:Proteasome subunit alpha type-2 n=1 Tax=Saitozyma podzolica TaxID=1890683 RepID=A0A427YS12_9TREE|nr:Proteasome subunit alpha type-2 [Saitozyma podzolica]